MTQQANGNIQFIGATPEYGKALFLERLEREIQRTKEQYPQATYTNSQKCVHTSVNWYKWTQFWNNLNQYGYPIPS